MTTPRTPPSAELRAQLADAESRLPGLVEAHGIAVLDGDPEAARSARVALQEAEATIADLKAAIPVQEHREAEQLAQVQAELRARQIRKLGKELRELHKKAPVVGGNPERRFGLAPARRDCRTR
jgi:hypothetical protein